MKYIELRRHTMRVQPKEHLSQEGVRLARRVGEGMKPFDLVVMSRLGRAYETAIAMGFAVDQQSATLNNASNEAIQEMEFPAGFSRLTEIMEAGGAATRFALKLAAFLGDIAWRLPEDGRALVISHGGFVEVATIVSLPDHDLTQWGPACDYCEGVELAYFGRICVNGRILRLSNGSQ